jgi:hypothetical protein
MLPFHPAPSSRGIGVFMPALWTIPENPIMRAYGLGDIVDGLYSLPENPIVLEIIAKRKMAEELQKNPLGPVGLSCGPSTCPCQVGLCGVSGTVDELMAQVTSSMGDWKTWAMVGAGVLALVMFTGGGGSQRRSEIAAARAQYKAKVASIKAARPRRYQKFV